MRTRSSPRNLVWRKPPMVFSQPKISSIRLAVSNVANHLDYSSPQSFGRHVRNLMNLTALEFRDRYDGEGMLQHFRETLVLPNVAILRQLQPLTPAWSATYSRNPIQ